MGQEASGTGISKSFVKTYSTFSGVDITALFDDMTLMTVQGIAVSITREKVPVYVFGRSRPVSISRGKRGIAGTLQFVLFDRDALYALTDDKDHWYYAHSDEVDWLTNQVNYANYHAEVNGDSPGVASSQLHRPDYMDQVWPFDVTLIAQNEYGHGAWSAIIGVEIINEGGGISMDDLTNEEQATYIAIHRTPWSPLADAWGADEQYESYQAESAVITEEGTIGIGGSSQGVPAT
jgi:hypothetical protein